MSTDASLIQSEAAQALAAPAFSFFPEIEEAEKRLAEVGDFTGERLFRDRPGVYAAVVRMMAEGMSISATARALGVSRNTVCAVRDREGFSIEQDKKELLRDLRRAGRLSVEKVIELLPDVKSAKDAAITAAVMLDKQQLLSGEATARVERVDVRPDQVKAYLDSLPVVDAEVLEVISTGVPAGMSGQKGEPAAALPEPESDVRSDDDADLDRDIGQGWTTCRATAGAEAAVLIPLSPGAMGRGGGGAGSEVGAPGVMEGEKQNFEQRDLCSAGDGSDTHPAVLGGVGRPVLATERGGAAGGPPAASDLCKATKKKQGGGPKRSSAKPSAVSTKAPITKKKKGGSAS
jgi:hypothetical protein